jgi:hypothetical protein
VTCLINNAGRQAAHKKQQKHMFFARMKVNINFQCKTKLSKNYQTQGYYTFNVKQLRY